MLLLWKVNILVDPGFRNSCKLTLMLRIDNQLADHCLNDTYVSVKATSEEATNKCHPKVHRKAHNEEGHNGTDTARY